MRKLWVRVSVMVAGVLFLVFFMQFVSIVTSNEFADSPADQAPAADQRSDGPGTESREEIASRLIDFAILSLAVGLVAGAMIGRYVSRPVGELAAAARRMGEGEHSIRVRPRGSEEMVDLANAFNQMAGDLEAAETLRNNLMADVSHELRTPLTVLEGNLRAALDHIYVLGDAEIATLHSQTRHLIRLVDDLRELSLAEAGRLPLQLAETDLNALVSEVVSALEPLAAEKEIALNDEAPSLPVVVADAGRMRQVLFNLLFNALRHTPEDGTVTVSGSAGVGEASLSVTDTGEGLEPEELAAVFDRFYRVDKSRQRETGGSGLGLAIVKAIVEAHGGRVHAVSEGRGRGSRFTFSLPETGPSATQTET